MGFVGTGSSTGVPAMSPIYQDYFVALLLSLLNPLVLSYLGLAMVHMIAARYYLAHKGGQALAWCNGVASVFYVLLAYLYSLPH
jgi:hypothetical protein